MEITFRYNDKEEITYKIQPRYPTTGITFYDVTYIQNLTPNKVNDGKTLEEFINELWEYGGLNEDYVLIPVKIDKPNK